MVDPMTPRMEQDESRSRFASADRAVLATTGSDGVPHLVPVTFALITDGDADLIVVAVDHKPKRTTRLRRVENIRERPGVSFLVDHYSPDWDQLWWVRADASAIVSEDGEQAAFAIDALVRRYAQYREQRPHGPVIRATVDRWVGWSARVSSNSE